ncbi:hypothetical protein Tco_0377658 [Tanacetum coccineum]
MMDLMTKLPRTSREHDTFWEARQVEPSYTGPFKILSRIGPVSYRLGLPQELRRVHDVLYVSILKKCLTKEMLVVPLEKLDITNKLQLIDEPLEIIDHEVQHQVPNQFETPLVESEEDPASLQEILQESLKLLVRPQVASSPTCLQPPLQ